MRLVDADALKKSIKSYADDQYAENEYLGEYAIMNIINNAPTVPNEYMRGYEAAEREYKKQQGEWKTDSVGNITCSNCGFSLGSKIVKLLHPFSFPYCLECGAKMKGGTE